MIEGIRLAGGSGKKNKGEHEKLSSNGAIEKNRD